MDNLPEEMEEAVEEAREAAEEARAAADEAQNTLADNLPEEMEEAVEEAREAAEEAREAAEEARAAADEAQNTLADVEDAEESAVIGVVERILHRPNPALMMSALLRALAAEINRLASLATPEQNPGEATLGSGHAEGETGMTAEQKMPWEHSQNNRLLDAAAMHVAYPSFDVPAASRLDRLRRGDMVKVCRNDERFWVQVVSLSGETIRGKVSNLLIMPGNEDLPPEARIVFERRHVYDCILTHAGETEGEMQ